MLCLGCWTGLLAWASMAVGMAAAHSSKRRRARMRTRATRVPRTHTNAAALPTPDAPCTQHKSEDVQQFAAGALANLQLYRKKAQEEEPAAASGQGRGTSMSRKVAKILRRGKGGKGETSYSGGGYNDQQPHAPTPFYDGQPEHEAASMIQAIVRGQQGRREFERRRQRDTRKKGNRYNTFNVNDVRSELDSGHSNSSDRGPRGMPPLSNQMSKNPWQRALPGMSALSGFSEPMRRPNRLAPLPQSTGSPLSRLPLPDVPIPGARLGGGPGLLGPGGRVPPALQNLR